MKPSTWPLRRTSTSAIHPILAIAWLLWAPGACTLSPGAPDTQLIADDAPIFDQRFRGIDPSEIDFANFWTEGPAIGPDEAIPLHHRTFANIVGTVRDGIVNLYTRRVQENEARVGIHPLDFLPFQIPVVSPVLSIIPFQVPIPYRTEGLSLGSGFLINNQGFILTNAHVVLNATDISVVRERHSKEYPAKIIGIDLVTDTALIRIEPQPDMTALTLGHSATLETGEMVIAVGNPLGLNHTVSSGLISAKERIVPGESNSVLDYLQTDSAINPGSSGGPLLNLRGEVVGINTAIASEAQNIGFAIPIDTVKRVMGLLISGNAERGWFGAVARPAEPGEAAQLGHANPNAVIIDRVTAGSPADRAGLRSNDLILHVGGEEIRDFIAFKRRVIGLQPGEVLDLTLFRNGQQIELSSTLEIKPS